MKDEGRAAEEVDMQLDHESPNVGESGRWKRQ